MTTPAMSALSSNDTKLCKDAAVPRFSGNKSSIVNCKIGKASDMPKAISAGPTIGQGSWVASGDDVRPRFSAIAPNMMASPMLATF